MFSTMGDGPLLVGGILRHGLDNYGDSLVVTTWPDGDRSVSFAEVGERAARLARGLAELGVGPGDRVGTFMWNTQHHLEAYLAVPSMGAVLHTLNIRLFSDQLEYIVNHAEDKVLIVDASVAFLLERIIHQCPSVETVVVVGEGDVSQLGAVIDYESLLSAEQPGYPWPDLDERSAAGMCFTSGTTGHPKGVVYSHRSIWLHSLSVLSAGCLGFTEHDRVLPIVPMFHANGWGAPYGAFMAGADLIMPERFLQAAALARVLGELSPTVALGVPTVWGDLIRHVKVNPVNGHSLRMATSGGAAVPESMIRDCREVLGVDLVQGWGMTETSPVAALSRVPKGTPEQDAMHWQSAAGRILPGVEARIVGEDGSVVRRDGVSVGELEVRGPWVTSSYFHDVEDHDLHFRDGWLRTGDVGTLDERGFFRVTDRTKDVIKSGGEWISSVVLENLVMAHPGVFEAAVIAVPDERWSERPLVVMVPDPDVDPDPAEIAEQLRGHVAPSWIPEKWAFVEEIPKTSVGKFDKLALRRALANESITVFELRGSADWEVGSGSRPPSKPCSGQGRRVGEAEGPAGLQGRGRQRSDAQLRGSASPESQSAEPLRGTVGDDLS